MFAEVLGAQAKETEKRFKRINDELASRRHGNRPAKPGDETSEATDPGKPGDSGAVTREDLRAERTWTRTITALEAEGLDPVDLAAIEERGESLPPSERAAYAAALREGLELGRRIGAKSGSATRGREAGTERITTSGPRGRAEAPTPRASVSVPESWEEYCLLSQRDPARKAALDKLPLEQFDPMELRRKSLERKVLARRGGRL